MSDEEKTPISKDLQDLINLEIPPKEDKVGRNIVKLTIFCFAILILACVGGLVFALKTSLDREDSLSRSLSCVRQSSLIYDDAIANGVKLSVELKIEETLALSALYEENLALLAQAVAAAQERILGDGTAENPGADAVLLDIDAAVAARRRAVDNC